MYIHGEAEILYWKNWIFVDTKKDWKEGDTDYEEIFKSHFIFIGLVCAIVLILVMHGERAAATARQRVLGAFKHDL